MVEEHDGDELTRSKTLGMWMARRIWGLSHLAVAERGKRGNPKGEWTWRGDKRGTGLGFGVATLSAVAMCASGWRWTKRRVAGRLQPEADRWGRG